MLLRNSPPFRADHVGSLLRTAPLKEARAKHEKGEISADALKAVEDREIAAIIRKQEDIGLKAVTDGEFRRAFWNYDFLGALPGVEAVGVVSCPPLGCHWGNFFRVENEPPQKPELRLDTGTLSPEDAAKAVIAELERRGLI